jgi:adenosylmethionine-8-amino-7-oxononanoate aminotransferase
MLSEDLMTKDLIEFDQEHIWHPYTSMTNPLPVYEVVNAEGCTIELRDGTKLIDGMASWWSAIHGYNNPVLNKAATDQLNSFSHVMFGGLTHKPAVDLSKLLVQLTPDGLEKVFLCDSGSISVEVAIKMAIQYQHAKGSPEKHKLLTIRSGYHGDTFAAMSVCDPVTGMHGLFKGVLQENYFADPPRIKFGDKFDESDIESFKALIKLHHNELAAVILEPIVQGAGGMRFYSPDYLKRVRELCDEYNTLLICDEIATGFGRAGELFASNFAKITPDIICLGKALTGGYMTLAATLTTKEVAETISSKGGVFMHGPTFMGNPLACATAIASINLLLSYDWKANIKRINKLITKKFDTLKGHKKIADIRTLGAIGVIEMKESVNVSEMQKVFVKNGIWVRPFGKLVYIMPPYIITDDELGFLLDGIIRSIE